jgi:hypothetical protein
MWRTPGEHARMQTPPQCFRFHVKSHCHPSFSWLLITESNRIYSVGSSTSEMNSVPLSRWQKPETWGHWTNGNFLCNSNLACTWSYSLLELGYDSRKTQHGFLMFPSEQILLFENGQLFLGSIQFWDIESSVFTRRTFKYPEWGRRGCKESACKRHTHPL